MSNYLLTILARVFAGKGIDKRFPMLVDLYKQVYARVGKSGRMTVNIPLGSKLTVSTKDAGLGLSLLTNKVYEPMLTQLFLQTVKSGMTVLDIGANVGYYTVLASKLVGPKGRVYAFEPDSKNLTLLKLNISRNLYQNVRLVTAALSDQVGPARFVHDPANPGESHLTTKIGSNSEPIRVTTLDQFAAKLKLKRADVVKLDIEGAECLALSGGEKFLKATRKTTLLVECNPRALNELSASVDKLIDTLKCLGFRIDKIVSENEQQIYPYTDKQLSDVLNKVAYVNLIARK